MRDRLADESAEQREARLQQISDCLAAGSAEQATAHERADEGPPG